jgi:hypothetical protein
LTHLGKQLTSIKFKVSPMKKLLLSTIAVILMSSVAVYAEGSKKTTKKAVAKKERTKTNCPNKPGCICN